MPFQGVHQEMADHWETSKTSGIAHEYQRHLITIPFCFQEIQTPLNATIVLVSLTPQSSIRTSPSSFMKPMVRLSFLFPLKLRFNSRTKPKIFTHFDTSQYLATEDPSFCAQGFYTAIVTSTRGQIWLRES